MTFEGRHMMLNILHDSLTPTNTQFE